MDSLTSIEYQEKDPVYHQFEEFNKLTRKTKQIYLGISKQTFDVFDSLISLKKRNKKITQMPKKSNMLLQQQEKLGKEDILDSLIADIDIADDISELEINEPCINDLIFIILFIVFEFLKNFAFEKLNFYT